MTEHDHFWTVIDYEGHFEILECTHCSETKRIYVD